MHHVAATSVQMGGHSLIGIFWPFVVASVIGFVGAVLVGMSGTGGGSLVTPLLIWILAAPPNMAIGTDIVYSLMVRPLGALCHVKSEFKLKGVANYLIGGTIPGVGIGALLEGILKSKFGVNSLDFLLGAVLLVNAVIIYKRKLVSLKSISPDFKVEVGRREKQYLFVLGIVAGLLLTSTSLGSGSIVLLGLFWIFPKIPQKQLVGIDLLVSIPMIFLSSIFHLSVGNVNFSYLIAMLVGGIPGVILGSTKFSGFSPKITRNTIVTVLGVTGLRVLLLA